MQINLNLTVQTLLFPLQYKNIFLQQKDSQKMINFPSPPLILSSHQRKGWRIVQQKCYAFVFQISQLPRSLEIPSWAIFNSPFCLDFENVQFVIFWLNLD